MLLKNIPILRIFDVTRAKEFYIDWLRFKIDFEHQFEETHHIQDPINIIDPA